MVKQVNRFNSENAQHFLISDLPRRISILDDEQYLFLPADWIDDEDFVFLKFRAEQKGYNIEYADSAPESSIKLIFHEIEKAINSVTGLEIYQYAIQDRTTHLYYARVVYVAICRLYKLDKRSIADRINKSIRTLDKAISKHDDLFKFESEYRRMYNDVMQIITNNQVIERV